MAQIRTMRRLTAAVSAAALSIGMVIAVPGLAQAAPGDTEIQILGINDFHGRIQANGEEAGAAMLAGAVKQLRADNPNTVFAAAGDLIGASTFESFVAHDEPTIDALNEAGLDVSSVGNHEFDQGYADLIDRVVPAANWKYLSANVVPKAGSDWSPLDKSWITEVGGVKVGFVGAVTEHLNELVSPGGIKDLVINDIATAVNAEATTLKADGAKIVVLLVHEGYATTDCTAELANSTSDFGKVVSALNADVDAVISGHTHLEYDCSQPVSAWAGRAVTERPIMSAGQYGYGLDQLNFTVNSAGVVTKVETTNLHLTVEVPDPANPGKTKWIPNDDYASDAATEAIVADAVANAEVLGAKSLGKIAGPFYRANLADGSENRGGESNLGNLVAEAQRWATRSKTTGSAQIAFMNPGGLRADMVGNNEKGYPATLTYKQAATVQPFANTLVNMTLTGKQIKKVLEQQWQPEGASRPFLRLGVSAGFTYTYVEKAKAGQHVIAMYLNGKKIKPKQKYSVTVNSFLSTGGDNFAELANGANMRDTGQTDLAGMVDYMAAKASGKKALKVDNSQRSLAVKFPKKAPKAYKAGDTLKFTVGSLTFPAPTDADRVHDKKVRLKMGKKVLGTFKVSGLDSTDPFDATGTATIKVKLPKTIKKAKKSVTIEGVQTGTSIKVKLTIKKSTAKKGKK